MGSELHQNKNEGAKTEANEFTAEKVGQKTTGWKGQMGHVCNQMEKENAAAAGRAGTEIRQQKEIANQEVQEENVDQKWTAKSIHLRFKRIIQ